MAGVLTVQVGGNGGGGALTAYVTVPTLSGSGSAPGTIRTDSATGLIVIGGVPPYSYSWEEVTTEGGYAMTSSSATTRFARFFDSAGFYELQFKCVVTDSALTSVDSDIVTVSMEGY